MSADSFGFLHSQSRIASTYSVVQRLSYTEMKAGDQRQPQGILQANRPTSQAQYVQTTAGTAPPRPSKSQFGFPLDDGTNR